jgi:hypothetical protein
MKPNQQKDTHKQRERERCVEKERREKLKFCSPHTHATTHFINNELRDWTDSSNSIFSSNKIVFPSVQSVSITLLKMSSSKRANSKESQVQQEDNDNEFQDEVDACTI